MEFIIYVYITCFDAKSFFIAARNCIFSYFQITLAFETLSNVEKKRAYDSADPTIDDTVPTVKDRNRERFFEVFGPLFESNSRCDISNGHNL